MHNDATPRLAFLASRIFARCNTILAQILEAKNAKRGVASLCIGGGQGGAMLLERDAMAASRPVATDTATKSKREKSETNKTPIVTASVSAATKKKASTAPTKAVAKKKAAPGARKATKKGSAK